MEPGGIIGEQGREGGERYIYCRVTPEELEALQAKLLEGDQEAFVQLQAQIVDPFKDELMKAVVAYPNFPEVEA